MARASSKRKSRRASARRFRLSARKTANRLTVRVLRGGKSRLKGRRASLANRTKKQRRGAKARTGHFAQAAMALVAPIGLQANVTPQLIAAAPAFGDVLRSIGNAVAVTQTALDDTALESLKTLAGQKVDVPVLIEQTLLNDGTPDTSSTGVKITTASMPLTSIITPSMQQVDQMTLRMDMTVKSFDATSGIKFNQNLASAGVRYNRGSFGFSLSMSNTNVNAQFSNMSDFSSGSVMMSMDIVDRTGFKIPTPLEYGIGANLLVNLTDINQQVMPAAGTNPAIITRTAVLAVKEVDVTGAVNPLNSTQYSVIIPPELQYQQGTGTLTISYNPATVTTPYVERKGTITLGQLTKDFTFHL
jgi:hypothetical protein